MWEICVSRVDGYGRDVHVWVDEYGRDIHVKGR